MDTRSRIIEAAAAILHSGGEARLSVRSVATRAGVGASTLRYYFPTQRSLIEAALADTYTEAMPDERIRDRSVPARDRLRECLLNMLAPFDNETQARAMWTSIHDAFISFEAKDESRRAYAELARQADLRVESWLSVLDEEGALTPGTVPRHARFLITVIDGLSVARALPPERGVAMTEIEVLDTAIDAVVRG